MLKSLSLLAVLALSAIALPAPAHAVCDYNALHADALTFWRNAIGWSYTDHWIAWINGTSCGSGNSDERGYHQSGQPDYWELFDGTSCGTAGAIKQLNSQVYFKPTTWVYYGQFACTCSTSTGTHECHWL